MPENVSRVVWSTDWQPPSISALNLDPSNKTLCKAAGAWKGKSLSIFQEGQFTITTDFVLPYLRHILPTNMTAPDYWTLLHWYDNYILADRTDEFTTVEGSVLEKINLFPLQHCIDDVCRSLDWEGDSDVSGRGMLITYYIAAGLVTAYLLASILSKLWISRWRSPRQSKISSALEAFEASTNTFLDASLIFAASILAAACFRLSQAFLQNSGAGKGHWMLYASIGSVYMATFSVFPPLILQCISHGLRRHWLRIFLWIVVIILVIVDEVLFDVFIHIYNADKPSDILEDVWYLMCNPYTLLERGILPTLHLAQVLLIVNALCYITHIIRKRKKINTQARSKLGKLWQKVYQNIRILNATICCLLMWAMIGLFHAYRDIVNGAAGDKNTNSDWTFGQVLAVATWIPVVVEFLAILKYGPEKGLSKKLSPRYTVVSTTEPSSNDAKEAQYLRVEDGH